MSKETIALLAAMAVMIGAAGVPATLAQSPDARAGLAAAHASDSAQQARRRVRTLAGRGSQLGLTVANVTGGGASANSSPSVVVDTVESQSPGEKAGLRKGDLIVEYDSERVRSARQFSRLVQETVEGRAVPLTFVRGGERQTVTVTPAAQSTASRFDVDFDANQLRQDIERGLRDLPDFAPFHRDGPAFNLEGTVPWSGTPRGRLGVQLEELTPQLAEYFGAPQGGVLVSVVTEGSSAARAGLKAGDVITSVNGDAVRNYTALASELRNVTGAEVTMGVIRDRKAMTVKATLDEADPRMPARSLRSRRPA